jgi:5-methylcytosine-specific restriction endonuclease McrA
MTALEKRVESTAIRRRILVIAMGGKCVHCGATDNLEFHHKHPRTWKTRSLARWARQTLYEREFIEDKIELACGDCNKRLGEPVDLNDKHF